MYCCFSLNLQGSECMGAWNHSPLSNFAGSDCHRKHIKHWLQLASLFGSGARVRSSSAVCTSPLQFTSLCLCQRPVQSGSARAVLIATSERSVGASTVRRTTARRAHYTAQLHGTCRDVTARLRACVVSHVCCLLFAVTELAARQSEAVARALPSNEFLSMRAAFKVSARRVSTACVFILRIYCSFALAAPQCHSLPLFKRRERGSGLVRVSQCSILCIYRHQSQFRFCHRAPRVFLLFFVTSVRFSLSSATFSLFNVSSNRGFSSASTSTVAVWLMSPRLSTMYATRSVV